MKNESEKIEMGILPFLIAGFALLVVFSGVVSAESDPPWCFTQLTTDSARDWQPSWSYDGNKIVFISTRDHSRPDIWVMDADGNNETLLIGSSDTYADPSYKPPDDTKILFCGYIPWGSGSSIWTANHDGSGQTKIRYDPGYDFYQPCWSPDGNRIAYHGSPRYSQGIDEIYVMNSDGTGSIILTNNDVSDLSPTWSPDGSKIAFVSNRGGEYHVWIMNSDGSNPIDTGVSGGQPKWSPVDVDKIAFISNCDIWLLTNAQEVMAGGEPKVIQLTKDSANDCEGLAWSPYGNKIVFSSDRSGNFDIWVMGVSCVTCGIARAAYGTPLPEDTINALILNPLRELRDGNLKDEYVERYYDYSPELTMVMTRDPALRHEAARLLLKYSPMVWYNVYGIGVDKQITRRDVKEIASFTDRLERSVLRNRDEIGTERSEEIIKFLDEFKEQVEASKGKTFSEALQGSIYCKDEQMPVD